MLRQSAVWLFLLSLLVETTATLNADDQADNKQTFKAVDSLEVAVDESDDANLCLQGLCWEPMEFEVTCQAAPSAKGYRLVQFPSPLPSGDAINDQVAMEWCVAHDVAGNTIQAPAIVVVHESGSNMNVGRVFARALCEMGFHTFMVQLPYYGVRRSGDRERVESRQIAAMLQGVADVRRARDAVAVLPEVDSRTIALQGTSLGGFVSSTAASLDGKYDAVFLMLAGGDLYDIIQNGEKDAAKARERLARQGLVGERLKEVVHRIEPTRIAHRLNPESVWLFSGIYDKVVPQKNAVLLASSMHLQAAHHIQFPINHYSGALFLPIVFAQIRDETNRIHAQKK